MNYVFIEQHLCFVKITLKFDKIYNVSNVFFHPQIFYWQNKNTIKLIVKLNKTNKNLSMWCFWWIAIRWNFSKFNHIFIWFFCLDNNFHFVFHYKGVSNSTPIFSLAHISIHIYIIFYNWICAIFVLHYETYQTYIISYLVLMKNQEVLIMPFIL